MLRRTRQQWRFVSSFTRTRGKFLAELVGPRLALGDLLGRELRVERFERFLRCGLSARACQCVPFVRFGRVRGHAAAVYVPFPDLVLRLEAVGLPYFDGPPRALLGIGDDDVPERVGEA